jgi:hypothetical protein
MLVIDGPPRATRKLARYPAGPVLFPLLADNATVFLDDTDREDEKTILEILRDEFSMLDQTRVNCEKGCAVLQKGRIP